MERIGYDSPKRALQLLSVPHFIPEILKFYAVCLEFIGSESIGEAHIERILTFSRVALVSNDIQTIQPALKALLLFLEKIEDVRVLIPHAILSIGILLNDTQDDALDFVAKYTAFNSELLPTVVDQIAENLTEQQSYDFKELSKDVIDDLTPPSNKNYCKVIVKKLGKFVESVQEMKIHISQFPEFAPYFVFDGPSEEEPV